MGLPGTTFHGFHAHRDGTVVSAFITDLQTRQTTMRDPAEAQKELDSELVIWAGAVADPKTASN